MKKIALIALILLYSGIQYAEGQQVTVYPYTNDNRYQKYDGYQYYNYTDSYGRNQTGYVQVPTQSYPRTHTTYDFNTGQIHMQTDVSDSFSTIISIPDDDD